MDEATRCDRVLMLRGGRILADGRPDELTSRAGAPTLDDAFLRFAEASP
jgi:ABC-type multidrug transport system ATPase subunit